MSLAGRIRAYYVHDDPAAETANFIALVVGWNGPLYPVYVLVIAGTAHAGLTLLTMLATPFFLAVPWLSRRSSLAGRFGFVAVGAANTLWCVKLLGAASGVGLFLLPCAVLAGLLFRGRERAALYGALTMVIAAYFVPSGVFRPALIGYTPAIAGRLHAMNTASVLLLLAVLALQCAKLMRRLAGASVGG